MDINENVLIANLIDCYGKLLSEKQLDMITNFVFYDMSLSEIAENYHISRVAVLDAIKKAKSKLIAFENVVGMVEFKEKVTKLKNLDENLIKSEITKILEE